MVNLTEKELTALLEAAKPSERDTAFILLGYLHGLRRGELLALRGTDVTNGHVRIKRLKQRAHPIVNVQPLHEKERELVLRLAATAGTERLFNFSARYASEMFRRYLVKAGIYTFARQKSLHSLRHSCGTKLYRESKDIVATAQYLGQRNIESARRYTNLSNDEVYAMAAKAL